MLIREKDKNSLMQIFSSVSISVEVWAYGSRVTGGAHSGSDLDLVIRTQNLEPLPLNILTELVEKIRDSNIPILVELRDWVRLPKNFHANIELEHEVLFDNREFMLNEPDENYESNSVNQIDEV